MFDIFETSQLNLTKHIAKFRYLKNIPTKYQANRMFFVAILTDTKNFLGLHSKPQVTFQ